MSKKKYVPEAKSAIDRALEELSGSLVANKYVRGQMQFTDVTNLTYFLKAHGNEVRYCQSWNKFLIWNGVCWQVDRMGKVDSMVINFVHSLYRTLRQIKDPYLAADFEKHLIKSESYRRLQGLVGMLKMSEEIKADEELLDQGRYLFNVTNGTIDIETGKCTRPNPADYLTKQSRFIYDRNAGCPTWEKFLMQIMDNDAALIRFIQKAVGYSLTGDVSEQCLFILWGTGANGKSTFLNVLQHMFADYAGSTGTETFMKKSSEQSNDIARLRGLRFVTTSEVEQGKAMSESLIKQITGEDALTARFLYGEYFTFRPTFKIFMATNHKPRIKGADNGIWRRIKLIPFNVTIPAEQRDKNLTEKLLSEGSGILNWALEGYQLWKKEGLTEPDAIKNANEEYRYDMDSVGSFISETMMVNASGEWRLPTKKLYETYCKWCQKNNERQMSQKGLAIRLQEKGFKRGCSNGLRYWVGLAVRMEWV